ncbi:MAG: glycosyltransferase, partial [Candidatus Bathyarchaeota archaeon]
MSTLAILGKAFSYVALTVGLFFFLFACKYYLAILIALFSGGSNGKNGKTVNNRNPFEGNGAPGNLRRQLNATENENYYNGTVDPDGRIEEPFISIQLPFYNERNVARRIIQACVDIDYTNYEILVADDSRDETIDILKKISRSANGPVIKTVHRKDRSGFKGGALQKAVEYMDPRTEYIVVFDADFIPPSDILRKFLWYFEGGDRNGHDENGHRFTDEILNHYVSSNGEGSGEDIFNKVEEWYMKRRIGVVQGYQLHHLNKNENWITKGIRCEYSGGYMIERVSEEFFGAMKMITGSVFMIKADIVRKLGWTHSITEDWDLTIRMYIEGYKVLYSPLIQAPAEIPATMRAVAKQRMRWAEGHTFAVKKYFLDVLRSPNLTRREKLEFLYFSPYYLQSFFFLIGTFFWIIAELLGQHPSYWTTIFGWSLIISNLVALPLMSFSGLYLEQSAREDFSGILSFIVLSYVLTPFQAYAALKGLLEKDEGGWVRTLKTGSITDRILQVKVRRLFSWILPVREAQRRSTRQEAAKKRRRPSAMVFIFLVLMSSLIAWVTAAAISTPDGCNISTALTLEYHDPAVNINGINTNRILTHPDFTSLGVTHIDSFDPHEGWRNAWGFYLYGPLEADYQLRGELRVYLHMYAEALCMVDIRLKIFDIDENGRAKHLVSRRFDQIELTEDLPDNPVELALVPKKSTNFDEGLSILLEIWLKIRGSDKYEDLTVFL